MKYSVDKGKFLDVTLEDMKHFKIVDASVKRLKRVGFCISNYRPGMDMGELGYLCSNHCVMNVVKAFGRDIGIFPTEEEAQAFLQGFTDDIRTGTVREGTWEGNKYFSRNR